VQALPLGTPQVDPLRLAIAEDVVGDAILKRPKHGDPSSLGRPLVSANLLNQSFLVRSPLQVLHWTALGGRRFLHTPPQPFRDRLGVGPKVLQQDSHPAQKVHHSADARQPQQRPPKPHPIETVQDP
jgi:hypothetical protein